jgi:hypothetical protein
MKYEGLPAVECLILKNVEAFSSALEKCVQNAGKYVEFWHYIILHGLLVVQELQ